MNRRHLLILYMLLPAMCLSGCDVGLEADRHDVERLLLIQTMGVDSRDGGIEMSISSGLRPEDSPALVMAAAAVNFEDAIARLQNFSPENELFYAHVQYLLLGEEAARLRLPALLEWVERSPTLRMDTDMMVVRGRAKDAVVGSTQLSSDVTSRLTALDRESRSNGWTIYTLRQIAAALAEGRGALCLAVEAVPTDDMVFTEGMQADAVIPAGYAILAPEGLIGFLSQEQSLASELLAGDATGIAFLVEGSALEVLKGSAQAHGQWNGETLEGIDIQCDLQASILEQSEGVQPSPDELDRALSGIVAGWLSETLAQAQRLGCDFLDLERGILDTEKRKTALGESWQDIFPSLPVTVTVNGTVDRSYDLAE